LSVVGPVTDLPKSFDITWSIANGVGTYHGTNWDTQLTITKTNVLFTGQYIGSSGGSRQPVSWSFPRVTVFGADSTNAHRSHYNEWSIVFNNTDHAIAGINNVFFGTGSGHVRMQAVHAPEPSTLLLFPAMGLAWLAVFRRKLCKKAQDACPAESVTTVPAAV
jgi:hypothetical protein